MAVGRSTNFAKLEVRTTQLLRLLTLFLLRLNLKNFQREEILTKWK